MAAPSVHPPHPRRPPAHKSVSLRHTPPTASHERSDPAAPRQPQPMNVSSSNRANPPSSGNSQHSAQSSLLKPSFSKDSSHQSSNADNWFERSNNQLSTGPGENAGSEPPFYLRNSSSAETPPDVFRGRAIAMRLAGLSLPNFNNHSLPQAGSGSEEFRSIVDDLTVENKRLKRRLKKYEKMYDAHLQQERLFEIRVHGLPAEKKRELEDTLREFAMSLGQAPKQLRTESTATEFAPALRKHNTATSSHTSTKYTDSAYVSNSPSGQTPSATHGSEPLHSKMIKSKDAQRREDIQSYLHDIPVSLLPRQPVAMTEKAKRRLVVRRLEQIFAGKGAAAGGNQQPQQQQEVSRSAAHADREAIEAAGEIPRAEGIREARFLPKRSIDQSGVASASTWTQGNRPVGDAPDQRPTRPLDLDLYRAQVPQDNIEYIRHLGFSPANADAEMEVVEESSGWVYLNVLINMAQLHTLNVTNEFVRTSIANHSQKMALSRDGRKVCWKGGRDITISSSSNASPNPRARSPMRKKRKTRVGASLSGDLASSATGAETESRSNKLAYVPLFFRKQSSDGDETSEERTTSWESPAQEHVTANSSGYTSLGVQTTSSKRKRDNDGPIIFYNKAQFCTDLSGDQGEPKPGQPATSYYTLSTDPVGTRPSEGSDGYDRRPVVRGRVAEDFMDIDDYAPSQSSGEIKFSPKSGKLSSVKEVISPALVDFEASGLGGVQPVDNFQVTVQSVRTVLDERAPPQAAHFTGKESQSARALGLSRANTNGSDVKPVRAPVQERVLAVCRKQLRPSPLPEPGSLFNFSSPDGDESSDGLSDDSDISSLADDDEPPPSTVPQMLHLDPASSEDGSEETDEEYDDDDDDDDGSIDLLAVARELDPLAVHQQEREYNANMAERMAEEIPAGSSAATAGGGSGYNSPVREAGSPGRVTTTRSLDSAAPGSKAAGATLSESMEM